MIRLQAYIFGRCFSRTIIVFSGLTLLAFLFQTLSIIDVLVEDGISGLAFLQLVLLGLPAIGVILVPIGLPIGLFWALQQLKTENELLVARANGVSQSELRAPVIQLSVWIALAFFGFQSFAAPFAQHQSRSLIDNLDGRVALSAIRAGTFATLGKGVTLYVEQKTGAQLQNVMFRDERPDSASRGDYHAARGEMLTGAGEPRLWLENAVRLSLPGDDVALANFDAYSISLSDFSTALKAPTPSLAEYRLDQMQAAAARGELFGGLAIRNEIALRTATPFLIVALGWLVALIALSHRLTWWRWMTGGAFVAGLALLQLGLPLMSSAAPLWGSFIWLLPVIFFFALKKAGQE